MDKKKTEKRHGQDSGRKFRTGRGPRQLFGLFWFWFYLLENNEGKAILNIIYKGVVIWYEIVWNLIF